MARIKLNYFDTAVKQGLLKSDFFQDKKFVVYKWPFFVVDGKKKLVFKYENDNERLWRLLNEKDKEIYYVQLMEIDKVIHKFGKESFEVRKVLKKVDKILKKFVRDFDGGIFIWSDHGFVDVKNYINIWKILPKKGNYLYFIAGTTAHFWFND